MSSAIELQNRDIALLRMLFESRIMTLTQASALCFEGRKEAAKKRVQKLKAAGYISERARRVTDPSILKLTRKAFELLKEKGILTSYPPFSIKSLERRGQVSDSTIRHELAVMDVKAALVDALRKQTNFSIEEACTWPLLCEFKACPYPHSREVLVRPDGFFRIHEHVGSDTYEHAFFVELDRSTESQQTLAAKAGCYMDFYRRGGFAVRCGGTASQFKDFPFRVLMICKTEERRNNAAERMLTANPPIFSMVWLSTITEVRTQPLERIWVRPQDYQVALGGRATMPSDSIYRRQTERYAFISKYIGFLQLFGD